MSRPSSYNDTVATRICAEIADGRSLRSICSDSGMPDKGTVLRWLADPKRAMFRDQYASAREAQADALVEECLEIADDGSNDWMTREGKDKEPAWALNGEHVNRSRLRVDTRKWWAARLAPKKYGDKQEVVSTQNLNVKVEDARAQIEAEIVEILALPKPVTLN